MHIVLKTTELILIAGYTTRYGIDGSHSLVTMSLGLSYDIEWQLTHMRLMLPLLLYIFDEFLEPSPNTPSLAQSVAEEPTVTMEI